MSRIPLLAAAEAPPLARRWYREDGGASPLTRSLATSPDVMESLMPFLAQILSEGAVDLATKELVTVRVSHLNGCRYCIAAHRPIALEAGIPAAALDALCSSGPLDLAPRERAIVQWVDAVVLDTNGIADELAARVLEHVREDQLVELTILVGAITLLNQYCTAFDLAPPVPA